MEPLLEPTEGSEELKPAEQAGIEEYLIPDYPVVGLASDGKLTMDSPVIYLSVGIQKSLNDIFTEFELPAKFQLKMKYCFVSMLEAKKVWKQPIPSEILEEYAAIKNKIITISTTDGKGETIVVRSKLLLSLISHHLKSFNIPLLDDAIDMPKVQEINKDRYFWIVVNYLKVNNKTMPQRLICGLADRLVMLVNFNDEQLKVWTKDDAINRGKQRLRNLSKRYG